MNDPYVAFSDESRQVSLHTYTNLIAKVIVNIIAAAEHVGDCETLAIRKELATQLMPLLVGGESPVFGAVRGKLIDTLLSERHITRNIDRACATCWCARSCAALRRRRGFRQRSLRR